MASLAAHQTANLPSSVEGSYRKKCKDLKKRINEIESSNELLSSRIQRARRAIQRMRLERAFLLQQLEARTEDRVSDSDGSPSPPPTPVSKPRQKRPRNTLNPNDSPFRTIRSQSPIGGTPDVRDQPRFIDVGTPSGPPARAPNREGKRGRAAAAVGPKKPANAYMYFCELERANIIARDGDKEGFEMPKALAQAWRDLKPEGQKYYIDQYEEQKGNYARGGGRAGGMGVVAPTTSTPNLGPIQMARGASVGSSVAAPLMGSYEEGFDAGAASPSVQDESMFDDAEGNGD
ncbi:hypothetical protein EX30DRAFT_396076 [Ascodesmis nigricans]|uniref:HMG box domain-containing protein n=1 Tax=Ascodesmis nigricans TaxID=341454 RepID=A0A4S2MWB9_9PEZI|nr:hypothetical protein EX30DRAFT_396076 [Ascodesmis nigricans]